MRVEDNPGRGAAGEPGNILESLYRLVDGVSRASSAEAIYDHALQTLSAGIAPDRAAVLVCDDQGVMRFGAWRGLSDAYRSAVEGHSPWPCGVTDPQPVVVPNVEAEASLATYQPLFRAEGVGAIAFIPLTAPGELLGKFMVYYDKSHEFSADEIRLAQTIAHHVAFGLQRLAREQESTRLKDEVIRLHGISQRFLERGNLGDLLS